MVGLPLELSCAIFPGGEVHCTDGPSPDISTLWLELEMRVFGDNGGLTQGLSALTAPMTSIGYARAVFHSSADAGLPPSQFMRR
jgi:hypothetical protein